MTLQQLSSLTPSKAVNRPILHSQKKLQRLTKAAVDRAYQLHTEARRLVCIVEAESCSSSRQLGFSNPLSSFIFSVLLRSSPPSKSPSISRNWVLPKESSHRRSVTARIQTLLLQWRADSSLKWKARVASVVPVLEEALYKEAKSKEEYTNPELLESRLMHVLCHFEAGNGPFLLQGRSPLYPLRNWYPPCSSSDRMSPLCQYSTHQGAAADDESEEIASEETYERARLSCASGSGPHLTDVHWEIVDLGQSISKEAGNRGHAGKKFVRKVANMLAKKRMEKSEPGKGGNQEDAEKVEKISVNAEKEEASRFDTDRDGVTSDPLPTNHESLCYGDERRKRTLGGMLGLNMFQNSHVTNAEEDEAPLAFSTTETTTESTPLFHAEEAPLSLRTLDDTSQDMIYNIVADAMEPSCIRDSQAEEAATLSFLAESQVVDNEASNVSTTVTEVLLESSEPGEFLPHGANCACRSLPHSCCPLCSSALTLSSSSSPSLPFMSHPAPLSSPSLPHLVLPSPSSSPSLTRPALSSRSRSPLASSSPSPSRQQLADRSMPYLTPLPQLSQHELVPVSTKSDMYSVELNHTWRLGNQNWESNDGNEMKVLPQLQPMASCGATESATQVAFGGPTTQAASEQPTGGGRRASSSTLPLTGPALSSPSPSHLASSSPLFSSSSSPSQQQSAHRSMPCLQPLPQHQSPHHELVPVSTSSGMSSVELNHAWRLVENQNWVANVGDEMHNLPQLQPMASCGATESATQVAFEGPTAQAASEQPTEGERRASSSTSPQSVSGKVLSRTRERGAKVPLRSFLADREEYKACISRYEEKGPWETWEEVTEQLDGMCCVCMVGFKGAAFIPCGHTFCRKCSRELWRGRGTCPLCNRYIREILDIF